MTTIPADRLDKLVARWETVQGTLAAGADQESYVRLSREFAELDPIVATINALRKAGITTGCDATHYCPTGKVSREQMAGFLNRALGD